MDNDKLKITLCSLYKPLISAIGCLALAFGGVAAHATALDELLRGNRYKLTVENGEMGGPGGQFLSKLISASQFVAIGEEHGTREVPQFVQAACRVMARADGLDAMAVEAGPLVTEKLRQWMGERDGSARLAAFEKEHPDSIAFFYLQQEFDLLSHCQQAAAPRALHVWGLDQEFLGSPGFLLQEILATRPGPEATAIANKLLDQCSSDMQKSLVTGSWKDACILRLSAADLVNLQSAIPTTGHLRARELEHFSCRCIPKSEGLRSFSSRKAALRKDRMVHSNRRNALVAALVRTQHIYSLHVNGHPYDANRERGLLMKQNFVSDYQQLLKANLRPPRVLLKFGDNHLYKGMDQVNLPDLGNFVSEFADGLGSSSLHISVLGVRGEVEQMIGPGTRYQPARADFSKTVTLVIFSWHPYMQQQNRAHGRCSIYDHCGARSHRWALLTGSWSDLSLAMTFWF